MIGIKPNSTKITEDMSSHLPELTPAQNSELTAWLKQFSITWQSDSIDQVGPTLQAYPTAIRKTVILEILKTDLQLAWQNGIPRKVSAYQALLEAVGSDDGIPADLIFSEFLARYQNGDKPNASEFKKRFPQQYPEFKQLFLDEKAKRQSGSNPVHENTTAPPSAEKEGVIDGEKIEVSSNQESTVRENSIPQFQINEQKNVSGKRKSYRKKSKSVGVVIGLLLGGLTTIPLGLALLWIIDKQDPLGIFSQFASESVAEQTEPETETKPSIEVKSQAKRNKKRKKESSKKSTRDSVDPKNSTDQSTFEMDTKAFRNSANSARQALIERDFDRFDQIIRDIEQASPSAEQKAILDRLSLVGKHYKTYRDEVIRKCALLKSGEEFTWSNGERISIVDASETKIVYRRGGQRIQESPAELQDGFALKVLEHNENSYDPEILLLRGSVFAVRSFAEPEYQARAKKTWELVDSDVANDLLKHLLDPFGNPVKTPSKTVIPTQRGRQLPFNSVGFQQKHPVPAPKQLANAKTAVDSAFQDRLDEALKMKDRQAKLQTLNLLAIGIQDAIKDEDDIINTYAIFEKAIEVGKISCNSKTTLNLVDQFSEQFAVDELDLRLELFEYWQSKIPDYFQGPSRFEKFRALAVLALPYAEKSESSYRWQLASDYFELLEKLARACNEKEETQKYRKKSGDCQNLAKREIKINQLIIDLESNPADSASIQGEIGQFYCFEMGDWETGLPYLEKSDDSNLSKLATVDLQHNEKTAVNAGNAWWEAAEDRKNRKWSDSFKNRAGQLYEEALPNLKGLERNKIEGRLKLLKS